LIAVDDDDLESVPLVNTDNPHLLPPSRTFPNLNAEYFWGDALSSFSTPQSLAARNATMAAISGLVTGNSNVSSEQECGACMQGLQLAQALTWDYPWETVSLVVDLCTLFSPTYRELSSLFYFWRRSKNDRLTLRGFIRRFSLYELYRRL
jgi:hypothetical protein